MDRFADAHLAWLGLSGLSSRTAQGPARAAGRVSHAQGPSGRCSPELAHLVRTIVVDAVEGFAEVVRHGVGGGDDMVADLDLDSAVVASGLKEVAD